MQLIKHNELRPFLQLYLDLNNTIIDFVDRNHGILPVDICCDYINKCVLIIIENNSMFV